MASSSYNNVLAVVGRGFLLGERRNTGPVLQQRSALSGRCLQPSMYHSREFVCITTVILTSGAENLGSELPVVYHFAFIRHIGFIGF